MDANTNRYELAIEDMERLRKARTALTALAAWLDDKEQAAEAELRACEVSPGIPLPHFNPWSEGTETYDLDTGERVR
jgi:hypothetical protein